MARERARVNEEHGLCCMHKHKGWIALVLGLLILANAYWKFLGWAYFAGLLLVIAGAIKLIIHSK